MPSKDSHVIEFYGETCPHCISMKPVVAKIEASHNITVKKLEVWNHPANQKIMEKFLFGKVYDQNLIGRDLGKILDETNELFKFELAKEFTFFVNCILIDKSKGTTEFGSVGNNNKEEDLDISETYTTDKAADKGILAVIQASFFKIK